MVLVGDQDFEIAECVFAWQKFGCTSLSIVTKIQDGVKCPGPIKINGFIDAWHSFGLRPVLLEGVALGKCSRKACEQPNYDQIAAYCLRKNCFHT